MEPGGPEQDRVYDEIERQLSDRGVGPGVASSGEQVSKAPFDAIEPSWLADGRHLVYTARDRTSSVLAILDTETGRSTPRQPAVLRLYGAGECLDAVRPIAQDAD